jgi:hypothetical protein
MDVYINQSRGHDQSAHVDDTFAWLGIERADRSNHAVVNAHISDAIQGTCWVDDVPSAKKQATADLHARTEKNRLAVLLGPGDGRAVEHLVMDCVTNSLVAGVRESIGISRGDRQKSRVAVSLSKCGQLAVSVAN